MNPVRPEEPLSLSKGRLEGPAQVVRDASSSSSAAPHHERMWVPATATPPSRPCHQRNAATGGTAPRRPATRARRVPSTPSPTERDRKSVVQGKRVSVRVDLGGRRNIKKKNKI